MKVFVRIIISLSVLVFVWLLYFATQVSATYPPIKTYEYTITEEQLHQELLIAVSSNSTWTIAVSDTTGTTDNFKYYCKLFKSTPKDSLTFSIFFQKTNRLFNRQTESEMGLVQAWDNIKWKGGYKMDDPEVEELVKLFESEIVSNLPSNISR